MSLENLQKIFTKKGWKTAIEEETEISPKQLVIPLREDLLLRLSLVEVDGIHFLQYYVLFHVEVKAVSDLMRLILSVNSGLDMGGFGYLERNNFFYYRFVQIYETLNERILDVYFNSVCYLMEEYVPTMLEVARGDKPLEQLQKEAERALEIGSL